MLRKTIPDALYEKLKTLAYEYRREHTLAEHRLWQHLRNRKLCGVKFRRQHEIYCFIVDFASFEAELVIEVDGLIHQTTVEYDTFRPEIIEAVGYTVLRFSNQEVFEDLRGSVGEDCPEPHPLSPSASLGRWEQTLIPSIGTREVPSPTLLPIFVT